MLCNMVDKNTTAGREKVITDDYLFEMSISSCCFSPSPFFPNEICSYIREKNVFKPMGQSEYFSSNIGMYITPVYYHVLIRYCHLWNGCHMGHRVIT